MMLAPGGEVGGEQLAQVKGRSDAHRQCVLELLIGAVVDAAHHRRRVVHQHIHPTMLLDDCPCKIPQHGLVRNVAHIMVAGSRVDDADMGSVLLKFLRDAFANAARTAGDDDYFILEHTDIFLSDVGNDFSPILDLIVQVRALLAVSVQSSHSTAVGEGKDMSGVTICQGDRDGIMLAFNEVVVILDGSRELRIKRGEDSLKGGTTETEDDLRLDDVCKLMEIVLIMSYPIVTEATAGSFIAISKYIVCEEEIRAGLI